MEEKIPIGDSIYQKLKEEERSIAWLSGKVYCSHNTLCDILKRDHLVNTDLLLRISKILKHDFFAYYSAFLEEQCLSVVRETNIEEKKEILIGNLIHEKLEEEKRSVAWLARKVHPKYDTFYKILKQDHIDTMLLLHISNILKYDFFVHYSALLKKTP